MKTYTQEELNEILKLHKLWLEDKEEGKRADLSRADLSGADLTGARLSGANLSSANLAQANLSYANLSNANLFCANLSNANLFCANLSNANLPYAKLFSANLSRTYLSNVSLNNASILSFTLGKHMGVCWVYEGTWFVRIGCIEQTLTEWLENYKQIGKEYGYTDKGIDIYGMQLELLNKITEMWGASRE